MITLYTWATPNGNKLHIMLEECGLAYEVVPVRLGKREQHAPAFLRINPNGKIPAMVDEDGPAGRPLTLFESGAMLIYLAEKSGRFLPQDPESRYLTLQWLMFQVANTGPMFGQLHHFKSSAPERLDYPIRRYEDESRRLLGVLETRLAESPFLSGPDYTIADISNWTWCRSWIHTLGYSLAEYPHVNRWFEVIAARDGVRRGMDLYEKLRASAS